VISDNESFSELLWGYNTTMFLQAINRVPTDNMQVIFEQAQQYMKATTCGGRSKTDSGATEEVKDEDVDKEYVDLFAFR